MRRRGLLALVALVGVLAVGVVAADRVGEGFAEDRIAERLAPELGTTPAVEIGGPFLLQALRGRYAQVDVTTGPTRLRDVPVARSSTRLTGLRLPLGDAVRGAVDEVPVDEVRSTALVRWDDVEAAVGRSGVELARAGSQVRISGDVSALGTSAPAVALADVAVEADALVLRPRSVEVAGVPLPGAVPDALGGLVGLRLPVPPLPYGLRLQDVRPVDAGLELTGSAAGVVLRSGELRR